MAAPSRSHGKIVLVGCHGHVGKATVCALDKSVGCDRFLVLSRDPSSYERADHPCRGCRTERGDLNEVDSMKPHFTGASAVFIVTPGAENRADLVRNGLNAAKASSVPFVMVVSVTTADNKRSTFGSQFSEIEKATKECGIPYCILRLPLFYDNLLMEKDNLRSGKFWGPVDASAKCTKIAAHDVGEAAANILANPSSHHNKTYNLIGPSYDMNDVATAFSTVLGRRIAYEQKPYEEYEKYLRDKGMEGWQAKGTIELFHMIDEGRYNFTDSDFRKLVGREPWNVNQWIENHRSELLGEGRSERAGGAGGRAAGGMEKHSMGMGGMAGREGMMPGMPGTTGTMGSGGMSAGGHSSGSGGGATGSMGMSGGVSGARSGMPGGASGPRS